MFILTTLFCKYLNDYFNLQDKFRIFILNYTIILFPLVAIQKYVYRIYYANSRFKNKIKRVTQQVSKSSNSLFYLI